MDTRRGILKSEMVYNLLEQDQLTMRSTTIEMNLMNQILTSQTLGRINGALNLPYMVRTPVLMAYIIRILIADSVL